MNYKATGSIGAAVVLLAIVTAPWLANAAGKEEVTKAEPMIIHCKCKQDHRHWTQDPLEAFHAERTQEQSTYLSVVKLVELERSRGDVRKVLPQLGLLVQKSTSPQLKNAIRRLIVDISVETRDLKTAEYTLDTIINEGQPKE